MLLGILIVKFRGEAQADIEHWERSVRLFEKQTNYTIPDIIKAGILINGLTEETLRSHMVMHTVRLDTYDKLKQEVTEIARAKNALSSSATPMDVDALWKGNGGGKGKKGKDAKGKSKGKDEKGSGKGSDKDVECFYCGKKGHRKADCRKKKADLDKAKAEGRPVTAPQGRERGECDSTGEHPEGDDNADER